MADEDVLTQAASAVQSMVPVHQNPTQMAPMPLQQPPPMPRYQPQPAKQATGEFQTVGGRKRADRQALIGNIANLVKQGGDVIEARKERALTMTIESLINAQNGRNEAIQSLQANPNDPDAKEAVERNTHIINTIMSDPKHIKQLQKAFNIDLFGTGKNQKENKSLIDAVKNTSKNDGDLSPNAKRLLNSQPVREQLSRAMQVQKMLVDAKVSPDANAALHAQTEMADHFLKAKTDREKQSNDLKIAEMTANKVGGEGTLVVDTDPTSLTGVQKLEVSPNGKTIRSVKNVIMPSILPSEHDGISTLTVADPNSPTGSSIVRIPNHSNTKKTIPGVGTVGAGGVVQHGGAGGVSGSPNPIKKNILGVPTHGETKNSTSDVKRLGLPPGSVIISAKALSPVQVEKLKEGITAMDGTVTRLKELREYTDIYEDMFQAGKVKFVTDGKTGKRIFGGFIPSTDTEKKAAAAWQESAEYMNTFRQALNAQGFRSIPAYDNMLALRGQLWQDKKILNKTLDDSIEFMQKEIDTKKKVLGEAPTDEERKKDLDKEDPAGLFPKK